MTTIFLFFTKENKLKSIDVSEGVENLYYLEAILPSESQIKQNNDTTDDNYINIFKDGYDSGITEIKKIISQYIEKIPLYDAYSENLYLINKINVYDRVVYQHYRLPTNSLLQVFKDKKNSIQPETLTNQLTKRKYRKLTLMIDFLNAYDLDILFQTYTFIYYSYANDVGKNTTTCKRPSFLSHLRHITPYYTSSEIINLALNMGLKIENTRTYEKKDIEQLCPIISSNDISANILLEHQKYIIKEKKVGLLQYYTLQGSNAMNWYLREMTSYDYKNIFLETLIKPMYDLLKNAPAFDKNYTLYRFISDDSYLRTLQIGDMHIESSFISTTRDPFYQPETYKFGYILIKINIPKHVKGVALCVETISHFPKEQEIILGPSTVLRLDKKDDNILYYHTDDNLRFKVKKRYEFTYIGIHDLQLPDKPMYTSFVPIDFLNIQTVESVSLEEKISYFLHNYVNPMYQFYTYIGDDLYTIITERYNSTGAYKPFYAIETNNGLNFYTIKNDYILFMIEIGHDNEDNQNVMHVNYFTKYSAIDRELVLDDNNFIKFISSIAYYFQLDTVILWTDWKLCDSGNEQNTKNTQNYELYDTFLGGNYCIDFYVYLKNKIKRYKKSGINNVELHPKFSYHQLDKLFSADFATILRKDDLDEIYQIYDKIYKHEATNHSIADFYVWMVENKCYLVDILSKKMYRFFGDNNPFSYSYYVLDYMAFLYNKNYIHFMPSFYGNKNINYYDKKYSSVNKYRLDSNYDHK